MITVEEAIALVKQYPVDLDSKFIKIENSCGFYLFDDIYAARKQPPFDRVAMDGIALSYDIISKQTKNIALYGVQRAGAKALSLEFELGAIEVMTGAPMPDNCDTVIPYEKITVKDGFVDLDKPESIKFKQNIHFNGSDYQKGQLLIEKGEKITSSTVAIMASQGMTEVKVKSLPKIAIISTGDELVEPGLTPEDWQIWRSNPYTLKSELIGLAGIKSEDIELFHIMDDEDSLYESLGKILTEFKVLVLSGGVSKGKFDYIPSILNKLGVEKIFHKIKQRPGKPMFFGIGKENQVVFGLPGNPVSSLVGMRRYVIESLLNSLKTKSNVKYVKLGEDIEFSKDLTLFKAMMIKEDPEEGSLAFSVKGNGSGNFFSLAGSDGFVELDKDTEFFKKGEIFPFYPWNKGGV